MKKTGQQSDSTIYNSAVEAFGLPHTGTLEPSEYSFESLDPEEAPIACLYEYARESCSVRTMVAEHRKTNGDWSHDHVRKPGKFNWRVTGATSSPAQIAWFLTFVPAFPDKAWQGLPEVIRKDYSQGFKEWRFNQERFSALAPPLTNPFCQFEALLQHDIRFETMHPVWSALAKKNPRRYIAGTILIDLRLGKLELREQIQAFVDRLEIPAKSIGRKSVSDKLCALGAMRLRYHAPTLPAAERMMSDAKAYRPSGRTAWKRQISQAKAHFAAFGFGDTPLRWTEKWGSGPKEASSG